MHQVFSSKEALGYFLIAFALVMAQSILSWGELRHGSLPDQDSYMRIVWLYDMLDDKAALHKVLRDGSGDGTVINWSHLLTGVIYLLALPLSAFAPLKSAIHSVAVIFGPITVGLLGALAAWSLAPVTKFQWRWLAAVSIGLSNPIVSYGSPGRADHHILLACVALAIGGWSGRVLAGGRGAPAALGFISGLGVWLSPEALPFVVMGPGACMLPWVFETGEARHRAGVALVSAGGALLVTIAFALLIDPPSGGYLATDNDRLSIVYLALALGLFLSFRSLAFLSSFLARPSSRAVATFCLISLALAGWVLLFPSLLNGFMPFSTNEEVRSFFSNMAEQAPISSAGEAFGFLADAAIATRGLIWFTVRFRSIYWLYATACMLAIVFMGIMHIRFLVYAGAASAAILPLLLDECTRLLSRHTKEVQAIGRLTLVFLTLAPNRLFWTLGPSGDQVSPSHATNRPPPSCNVR
jgi:hypothetical protein